MSGSALVEKNVRIVSTYDVENVLSIPEALEVTEDAFTELGEHPNFNSPRRRLALPTGVWCSLHLAGVPGVGGTGVASNFRQENPDLTDPPRLAVIHDSETGELDVIFLGPMGPVVGEYPSRASSGVRTACTSAIGADRLATPDATRLGVLGSGKQAREHIQVFDHIRPFDTATVYSPTQTHREAFVDEMQSYVDMELIAVDRTSDAIQDVDVILAVTGANSPVFDGTLLEPGQTVVSIVGASRSEQDVKSLSELRREIDDTTVSKADLVVANSIDVAQDQEQGDLYVPIENGVLEWGDIVELATVVTGDHPGRTRDDEICLFKNNCGMGIVDIALATETWKQIRETDIGQEITYLV